jgi:hypothetical protein
MIGNSVNAMRIADELLTQPLTPDVGRERSEFSLALAATRRRKGWSPDGPTPGLSYIQTYFDWLSSLAQASATCRSGSEPGNVAHPAFSMSSSRFQESVFLSASRWRRAFARG